MNEFEIRDPIHELIVCSKEEKELINSPLAQRLKWVEQLSMVNQVYNGAVHSRFSHCLGVMKLSGDYMEHLLSDSEAWNDWWRLYGFHMNDKARKYYIQLARIVGFLHDIGHGPFSHSFDHTIYKKMYGVEDGGHDIARLDLVLSPLLKPYIEKCKINVDDILKVWGENPKGMFGIIKNIVEGPLGADRIDFTRRDAYYTGMDHLGTIPTKRLIKSTKIVFINEAPMLTYAAKCMDDIIRTLNGRLNLYEGVYLHRISMAASLLIEKILEHLMEFHDLTDMVRDPEKFVMFNDHKIFAMAMSGVSPEAKKLYERLMLRQLPKVDHEAKVNNFSVPYDKEYYRKMWYPGVDPSKYEIVKTRAISCISAKKFTEYNIFFATKSGQIKTCQELLDEMQYQIPIKPYYIVRGFTF
ncbi:MAG TPA: HD domain-containing protein [Saprospiraceae bacterium]|nr:HD domain-containing protein [Saprospiraceae bacterium]